MISSTDLYLRKNIVALAPSVIWLDTKIGDVSSRRPRLIRSRCEATSDEPLISAIEARDDSNLYSSEVRFEFVRFSGFTYHGEMAQATSSTIQWGLGGSYPRTLTGRCADSPLGDIQISWEGGMETPTGYVVISFQTGSLDVGETLQRVTADLREFAPQAFDPSDSAEIAGPINFDYSYNDRKRRPTFSPPNAALIDAANLGDWSALLRLIGTDVAYVDIPSHWRSGIKLYSQNSLNANDSIRLQIQINVSGISGNETVRQAIKQMETSGLNSDREVLSERQLFALTRALLTTFRGEDPLAQSAIEVVTVLEEEATRDHRGLLERVGDRIGATPGLQGLRL